MANRKIYLPTFISDAEFNPARVNPRVFFYNGLLDCEPFIFEGDTDVSGGLVLQDVISNFPYFDHYSTGSTSQEPDSTSDSLLFFNENVVYGTLPTASLYTEYWEKYVSLLYDPSTRLLDASANIPLADYSVIELNDIVQYRGNYYHLRAINDYNISTGDCNIQLLGPVLEGSITITDPCTQSIDMGKLDNYICSGSDFVINDITNITPGYNLFSWVVDFFGTFTPSSSPVTIFTPNQAGIDRGDPLLRLFVRYPDGCTFTYDKPLQIVTPIGGTAIPVSQSVAYSGTPVEITVSGSYISSGSNPILPVTGSVAFQWYDSTDNTSFSLIPGETGSTYQGGSAFVDKWYRRTIEYVDLGCAATSSAAYVEVLPEPTTTTSTTTTAAPTTTTTTSTTAEPTTTTTTSTTAEPTTTTTTSTTAEPTTTTTTSTTIASGTCRFVFVPDYVDTTGYGLRTNLGGEVNQLFSTIFGVATTIGGESGIVYNVCSTIVPQYWEQSTNTTIPYPSGVVNLADGGSCTADTDCVYVPPTTTTTTSTTAEPTTTTTTSTTVAPTTTTTTSTTVAPNCEFVFVADSVDTTGYGLRYFNGGQVDTLFSSLFGVVTTYGGVSGVVYGVCSTIVPQYWEQSTNTTIPYPSGVEYVGSGGVCGIDTDCTYVPPTTTTTTAAPTTTTTSTTIAPTTTSTTTTSTTAAPTTTTSTTTSTTAAPLTQFITNASPEVSGESACSAGLGTFRYHDGVGVYPQVADTVYLTSSTGGGTLGAGYWGLSNGTFFQTDISGFVIDVQLCAVPTTTSTTTSTTAAPTTTTTTSTTAAIVWNSIAAGYDAILNTQACYAVQDGGGPFSTVYWIGDGVPFGSADVLYGLPDSFSQVPSGFYSDGTNWLFANSGIGPPGSGVTDSGTCPPPPTTTTSTTAAPTTTTTTSTTPAPNVFVAERNFDGFGSYLQYNASYSSGNDVLASDGFCWTLGTPTYLLDPTVYGTITSLCPPPTTTTTTSTTAAPASCTQVFMSTSGVASSGTACGGSSPTRRRHNGAGTEPGIGDTIFTNISCTTTFNGGNLWFYVAADGSAIQIGATGIVNNKVFC